MINDPDCYDVGESLRGVLTVGGIQPGVWMCIGDVDRRAGGYAASMWIFECVSKIEWRKGGQSPPYAERGS